VKLVRTRGLSAGNHYYGKSALADYLYSTIGHLRGHSRNTCNFSVPEMFKRIPPTHRKPSKVAFFVTTWPYKGDGSFQGKQLIIAFRLMVLFVA